MKRKNLLKLILGISLVTVMVISIPLMSGCAAPAPTPGEPTPTPEPAQDLPIYRWKFQVVWAPAETNDLARPWARAIEAMSGGRVKIDVYSAAELVPDEQCLQAVQSGTLDLIHHCAQSINLPLDIYDLDCIAPFLFHRDLDYWALAWKRGMAEIYEEAYMELGDIQYIGFITHDPSHLISTKPIWSYDDLKGLKINAFAPVARPFVEAGAISVVLPVEEFYLSGQTGVVDALCWCGATEATANSWNEVYNYFLTNPVTGGPVCHTLMNKELWDSLPTDLQEIMKYAEYVLAFSTVVHYYNGEPLGRKNFDLTTMPDEDWARVVQHGFDYLDEVAQKSPRNAKLVKMFKDFRAEMEEANWWR